MSSSKAQCRELDAKIADRLHWLDDVGADSQVQLTFWNFTKEPNQMSSVWVSLICSRREEHQSPTSKIQLCSVAKGCRNVGDWCINVSLLVVGIQMVLDSVTVGHLGHIVKVSLGVYR